MLYHKSTQMASVSSFEFVDLCQSIVVLTQTGDLVVSATQENSMCYSFSYDLSTVQMSRSPSNDGYTPTNIMYNATDDRTTGPNGMFHVFTINLSNLEHYLQKTTRYVFIPLTMYPVHNTCTGQLHDAVIIFDKVNKTIYAFESHSIRAHINSILADNPLVALMTILSDSLPKYRLTENTEQEEAESAQPIAQPIAQPTDEDDIETESDSDSDDQSDAESSESTAVNDANAFQFTFTPLDWCNAKTDQESQRIHCLEIIRALSSNHETHIELLRDMSIPKLKLPEIILRKAVKTDESLMKNVVAESMALINEDEMIASLSTSSDPQIDVGTFENVRKCIALLEESRQTLSTMRIIMSFDEEKVKAAYADIGCTNYIEQIVDTVQFTSADSAMRFDSIASTNEFATLLSTITKTNAAVVEKSLRFDAKVDQLKAIAEEFHQFVGDKVAFDNAFVQLIVNNPKRTTINRVAEILQLLGESDSKVLKMVTIMMVVRNHRDLTDCSDLDTEIDTVDCTQCINFICDICDIDEHNPKRHEIASILTTGYDYDTTVKLLRMCTIRADDEVVGALKVALIADLTNVERS